MPFYSTMLPRSFIRSSRRINSYRIPFRSFSSRIVTPRSNGLIITTVFAGIGTAYIGSKLLDPTINKAIKLEAPEKVESTIESVTQPDTNIQFPTSVSLDDTDFELLGVGVRSITYFFHVYALGVYIAKQDLLKAKQVLISSASTRDKTELEAALLDADKGGELISKLLAAGIRLSIRIIPVRNTDFGHLRDGFVRAVVGHPRFKQLSGDNGGEGINELKRAFGRKKSVPKGYILYLNRLPEGKLIIEYYQSNIESEDKRELLGIVEDPIISELLFLKYLSGKSPSSESARKESVKGLTGVIDL